MVNVAEIKFLNSREIKLIKEIIREQWDAELDNNYVFVERKNKLYITTYDIDKLPLKQFKRINNVGIYFGEFKHNILRLSIEGSLIIGKNAKKNFVVLDEEDSLKWIKREDIKIKEEYLNHVEKGYNGFVIVRDREDFLGCGKIKENLLLNFIPKARAIKLSQRLLSMEEN